MLEQILILTLFLFLFIFIKPVYKLHKYVQIIYNSFFIDVKYVESDLESFIIEKFEIVR